MVVINFFSNVLLFSIFFWRVLVQTPTSPSAIPYFPYRHCYRDNVDYSGYRIDLYSDSPHSPNYLLSKTRFVLNSDDLSVQPVSLSTYRHLVKDQELCESNVEFSTKNIPFSVLNLNIQLFLDYQEISFAEFFYQVHPGFDGGPIILLDKNRLVGLKVRITTSGEEHLKMVSVGTNMVDLSADIMYSPFWEGICVITKKSTGVVLKTRPGQLRQTIGFVNGIKVVYTKDGNRKERTYPAYPCDSQYEGKTVSTVIEEGVNENHVSFYARLQSYDETNLNPIPVTVLNKYFVTIDRFDQTTTSPKLYFISGNDNTDTCSERTEIYTYVTDRGTTLEAYRSRHAEIYHGIKSVFWNALSSPPFSCAA